MKKLTSAFWPVLIWGAIAWMSWEWGFRSWNELQLILGASSAPAKLVDTDTDEFEDYRGNVTYVDVGIYEFFTEQGAYKSATRSSSSKFPKSVDVEYLSDDPAVNRVRGDGFQTVWEWAWRRGAVAAVFLGLLGSVVWKVGRGANRN